MIIVAIFPLQQLLQIIDKNNFSLIQISLKIIFHNYTEKKIDIKSLIIYLDY